MKRTRSFGRIECQLLAGAVMLSVPVVALAVFGGNARTLFTTPSEPVAEVRRLDLTGGEQTVAASAKPAADTDDETEVQISHWENTTGPKKLSGNQ